MPGFESVRTQHFRALLLLDQLVNGVARLLGEDEIVEADSWRHDSETLAGDMAHVLAVRGCCCSQSFLEPLGEEVVLLVPLLGDHRLDRSAQLAVVALARCADKVNQEVSTSHP
jgi:hypothetical protein